jgi:hypothetical protein
MCVIVTVGVAGFRGDATAPFRAAGFTTRPAINPTSAAMPRDAVRIDVTAGGCSCDFYCGDTPQKSEPDPVAERRKYERKGWTQAKIDRAIGARRSARPATPRKNLDDQFAAAVESLAKQGARVTLLAHMFSADFDEPFEIVGTTELPLKHYTSGGNLFPEDTLVTIVV